MESSTDTAPRDTWNSRASFLEESNGAFKRHGGLMGEAWLVQDFFSERQFMAGIGAGSVRRA